MPKVLRSHNSANLAVVDAQQEVAEGFQTVRGKDQVAPVSAQDLIGSEHAAEPEQDEAGKRSQPQRRTRLNSGQTRAAGTTIRERPSSTRLHDLTTCQAGTRKPRHSDWLMPPTEMNP